MYQAGMQIQVCLGVPTACVSTFWYPASPARCSAAPKVCAGAESCLAALVALHIACHKSWSTHRLWRFWSQGRL